MNLRRAVESALSWVALADRMPTHEDLPEPEAGFTFIDFQRVLKESGLNRSLHRSVLGNEMRPFSVRTSQWLRSRR